MERTQISPRAAIGDIIQCHVEEVDYFWRYREDIYRTCPIYVAPPPHHGYVFAQRLGAKIPAKIQTGFPGCVFREDSTYHRVGINVIFIENKAEV